MYESIIYGIYFRNYISKILKYRHYLNERNFQKLSNSHVYDILFLNILYI